MFSDTIECTFPAPKSRKSAKTKKKTSSAEQDDSDSGAEGSAPVKKGKAKPRKKVKTTVDEEKDIASASEDDFDVADYEDEIQPEVLYGYASTSDAEEASWEISRPTKAVKIGKGGRPN